MLAKYNFCVRDFEITFIRIHRLYIRYSGNCRAQIRYVCLCLCADLCFAFDVSDLALIEPARMNRKI